MSSLKLVAHNDMRLCTTLLHLNHEVPTALLILAQLAKPGLYLAARKLIIMVKILINNTTSSHTNTEVYIYSSGG